MNDNAAETIFEAVLQLDTGAKKKAYLDLACGADAALRAKIEKMIESQDRADDFFAGAGVDLNTVEDGDLKTELEGTTPSEGAGEVIGRYKLLEKLGEGGFGSVWAAEQREPVKRRVALKIIKLGMDTKQAVARFEAERQALAMMDHPNIAKVLDAGTTGQASGIRQSGRAKHQQSQPFILSGDHIAQDRTHRGGVVQVVFLAEHLIALLPFVSLDEPRMNTLFEFPFGSKVTA